MTTLSLIILISCAYFLITSHEGDCMFAVLVGITYIPLNQKLDLGIIDFSAIRLLVGIGLLRVLVKGETLSGYLNSLDKLIILWAAWLICTSIFHDSHRFLLRVGTAFDNVGVYFLFRVFIKKFEDIRNLFIFASVLFIPLAVAMVFERIDGKNYLGFLGMPETVLFRENKFRATGTFEHPILAGTVCAACLPMSAYLWRQKQMIALIGLSTTGAIIWASASSGPVMTFFTIAGAMLIWKFRPCLNTIRYLCILLIVALSLVMNDPVYFLLARIDLAGGSTGWYRAALIQSAIEHFNDWWLVGTDFTRNWMHVQINETDTDITNYYVLMGILGGVPLLLIFISILVAGFSEIRRALNDPRNMPGEYQFMIWTLGSILFGHVITFFSVSYFDQSAIYLYLVLAMIGSLQFMRSRNISKSFPQISPINADFFSRNDFGSRDSP